MDQKQPTINTNIKKELSSYLNEVKKHSPIETAYLFGSQTQPSPPKNSDFDLAIISPHAEKNRHKFLLKLLKTTRNYNLPIEPHPLTKKDLSNPYHPLAQEIRHHGIRIS